MTIFNQDGVALTFSRIGDGPDGNLVIEFIDQGIKIEIISESSLYILDSLSNHIERIISKNDLLKFDDEAQMKAFAKILNYDKVFEKESVTELKNWFDQFYENVAFLEMFNALYFAIVGDDFYINYYSNIRHTDELEFDQISKEMVDKYIAGNAYRVVSVRLTPEKLKSMSGIITDLRNQVAQEVFGWTEPNASKDIE